MRGSKSWALPRLAAGWMLAAVLFAPATGRSTPRPLTAAEKASVELVAAYLERGAEAWGERLAADSPLAALDPEAARQEIAVRAGQGASAIWRLHTKVEARPGVAIYSIEFPSGSDETLALELIEEAAGWRLMGLRIAAEKGGADAMEIPANLESVPVLGATPEPVASPQPTAPYAAAGLAIAALLLLLAAYRRRRWWPLLVAMGLFAGAAVLVLRGATSAATPSPAEHRAPPRAADGLRQLLPLRQALTSPPPEGLAAILAARPTDGEAGQVAALWEAQHRLAALDLNGAETILSSFPSPSPIPLAELLRARLGFLRLEESETALAYERVLETDLAHDGLLLEAAQAFVLLGFEARSETYFEKLESLGSREAEVYYGMARAIALDSLGLAAKHFHIAWKLRPKERAEIVAEPRLAYLLEDFAVQQRVAVAKAAEPVVGCAEEGQAITLPAAAATRRLGGLLAVEVGEGVLEVPGGCALAPPGTEASDAVQWRQRREEEALATLPALTATAASAGALSQPHLRRQVEEAAAALARRGRWADLIALTEGLSATVQNIPPELTRLRANALRREGKETAALNLLTRLVKSNLFERRVDPHALYQLAELLVAAEQYDLALRLMAKAHRDMPIEVSDRRIRQVQLEKRLAASYQTYDSEHFAIRFPEARNHYFASRIADILEAEHGRLQRFIPVDGKDKTDVYLLPFEEFRQIYGSGIEVLGLYDGAIRLPFAQVGHVVPILVAIMSHEMAHAMTAYYTDDRAPAWFHEGLAQHVQLVQQKINPMPDYRTTGSGIAFPLLDSVLKGFASPRLVPVAYDEALWTMHYIESRHGIGAIHRLLDAFRDGLTSESAIEQALGRTPAQLDAELWQWALHEAPAAWTPAAIDYERYFER